MKVKMIRSVSGYVWGGIRLPAVGQEADVPDDCATMLIDSGNAVAAGDSAPIETASAPPGDVETADAPSPAKRRKNTSG